MSSKVHVLAIPFPLQGHINPTVRLSEILISRGIKVTFVTSASTFSSLMQKQAGSFPIEVTPDVFVDETSEFGYFIKSHEASISNGLRSIVEKMEKSGSPVNYIACDSITPWALDLAHQIGLKGIALSATTVAVAALYYHFEQGTLSLPPKDGIISLPSLPEMVESDLPSPLSDPTPYLSSLSAFSLKTGVSW